MGWKPFGENEPLLLAVPLVTEAVTSATRSLLQAYPNPFTPMIRISFELQEAGPVSLNIYDGQGLLVRRLQEGALPRAAPIRACPARFVPKVSSPRGVELILQYWGRHYREVPAATWAPRRRPFPL